MKKILSTSVLLFITIAIQINPSYCKCVQSYQTICDSVADIYNVTFDVSIHELIVKSNRSNPMVCLDRYLFKTQLKYVRSITFVEAINGVCACDEDQCDVFQPIMLKELIFHGNNLQELQTTLFPHNQLELEKLSLVKNNIKKIGNFAFQPTYAVDLSHNFIETISRDMMMFLIENTLILRNNSIYYIEPNSFGTGLQILDLSYNQLSGMLHGVVDHLRNLEMLYLSHNRLHILPNMTNLRSLTVFDISHNRIKTVDENSFRGKTKLTLINLSHNQIQMLDFLGSLIGNNGGVDFVIGLNFNLVEQIDVISFKTTCDSFSGIPPHLTQARLRLYGNPWICSQWNSFEKILKQIHGVEHTFCDQQHFSNGVVPYCIQSDEISEDEIGKFLEAVKENIHLIDCNLNVLNRKELSIYLMEH